MACGASIRGDFEQRRLYGLQEPSPAPADWRPDGALRLASTVVEQTLVASLNAAVQGAEPIDAGVVWIEPDLHVDQVRLVDPTCEGCIGLAGRLTGTLGARNRLGSTSHRVIVDFRGDCTLVGTPADEGVKLTLSVVDVGRMKVDLGEDLLSLDLAELLTELLTELPAVELGQIGGDQLPVAALRAEQESSGVRLVFLTATAHPGAIRSWEPGPQQGFEVVLSEESLLDRARQNAWTKGPGRLDIQVEPTGLDFEGEAFTLDLRLWRIQDRRSWWREVQVEGVLVLVDGELTMSPTLVTQVDKSPGAGLIDPVGIAIRLPMLRAIEQAVHQAIPLHSELQKGALQVTVHLRQARGEGPLLVLRGDAEVAEAQ